MPFNILWLPKLGKDVLCEDFTEFDTHLIFKHETLVKLELQDGRVVYAYQTN